VLFYGKNYFAGKNNSLKKGAWLEAGRSCGGGLVLDNTVDMRVTFR